MAWLFAADEPGTRRLAPRELLGEPATAPDLIGLAGVPESSLHELGERGSLTHRRWRPGVTRRTVRRAMRITLLTVVLLACVSAACSRPSTGAVSGGIQPCAAITLSGEPHYAAGTVSVLAGQVTWRSLGAGSWQARLPTRVVVSERVGVDATYSFTLVPGRYVLAGYQAGEEGSPRWVEVTVHNGETVDQDIPNTCK